MTKTLRVLALVLVALLVGCGTDTDGDASAAAPAGLDGEITVSAAASLTEAYTRIGEDFEAANPGTTVTFNFDSSGTLARQILDGAPVDVYASADEADMAELTGAGLVDGEPAVFARNQLAIVTDPGNPLGITELGDLADAGVIALCADTVPCGRLAAQVLADAGVTIPETRVTLGQNVKATLTAVSAGDAVAGIVYVTDAAAAGDTVATVAIPDDQNAIATYTVGVLAGSSEPEVARAFARHVQGDQARLVLEELGFLPPP
jgi:molybdate transport system substrate-binding protein